MPLERNIGVFGQSGRTDEWQENDRVLEALGFVDSDDLDEIGIALQAKLFTVGFAFRVGNLLRQESIAIVKVLPVPALASIR